MASKAGETQALNQLRQFKDWVVQKSPQSNLAGYVTYRALWSEDTPKLVAGDAKIQAEWIEKLTSFVQSYPKADDAPATLIQLAMNAEFNGKDDQAKGYYEQLTKNFPSHMMTAKAEGAVRRLALVGSPMNLSANTIAGQPFNITSLRGKVVAVYYWASYCSNCPADFAKLKDLREKYA